MPTAGIYNPWSPGTYYNPSTPPPVQTPSTNYLSPSTSSTTLPPPPTIPPYPTNPYLGNFDSLINKLTNYNFWQQLPPEVLSLINSQKEAALKGYDFQSGQMGDQLLTRLFGSGFQRSTPAIEQSQLLADSRAAGRAGVGAQYDNAIVGDMLTAGQTGYNALQGAGGLLGQQAGLYNQGSSQYYGALVNSLMQQYGYQNQNFFGNQDFIKSIIQSILGPLLSQMFNQNGGY